MQTDPTLLRYASVMTIQKKCWESSANSTINYALEKYSFSIILLRANACRNNNFERQRVNLDKTIFSHLYRNKIARQVARRQDHKAVSHRRALF